MEFRQQRLSNRIEFALGDDTFNYAFRDSSGSADVDLNYADMPEKSSERIERQDWWRNVGLLWMVIGAVQAGTALMSETGLKAMPLWLLLGAGCLAWYHLSTVKCSVLAYEGGRVYVIRDQQHDGILAELTRRKHAQLRAWYGEIDSSNATEKEIQKFHWLHKRGALSEREVQAKISLLQVPLLGSDGEIEDGGGGGGGGGGGSGGGRMLNLVRAFVLCRARRLLR